MSGINSCLERYELLLWPVPDREHSFFLSAFQSLSIFIFTFLSLPYGIMLIDCVTGVTNTRSLTELRENNNKGYKENAKEIQANILLIQ